MDTTDLLRVIRLTIKQMRVDEHPDIRKAHADEIAENFETLDHVLTGGAPLPADWRAE